MNTRLRYVLLVPLALSGLFVPVAVGRAFYFAFIWFSNALGFTPHEDYTLQTEAFGGAIAGGIAFALHWVAAFFLIEHVTTKEGA